MTAARPLDRTTIVQGLAGVTAIGVATLILGISAWRSLNPGALLLVPIVFASLRGGWREALAVGAAAFAFDAYWLHQYGVAPGSWAEFDLYRLAVFAIAAAALSVLPAHFRAQAQRLQESHESLTRARLERDLFQARSLLAEQEKLASLGALVNGVSHEMRTPLTGILNRTYLIERRIQALPEPDRRRLQELHEEMLLDVQRLDRLVENLRRYARIPLAPQDVLLTEAVHDVLRLYSLSNPGPAPLDARLHARGAIRADPLAVQQIVLHLVHNAVEASPPDRAVTVETVDTLQGAALVVSDRGPGIPPDVQARMFEEFFTTKPGHNGLGLSIVRRYAEAQGAVLSWTTGSAGTTFTVVFPPCPVEAPAAKTTRVPVHAQAP